MMRRLRIAYYMAPYSEGGIARHAPALIDFMRGRHSLVVFCDPRSTTFRQALAARGIDARDVSTYPREKRGVLRPAVSGCRPFLAARAALGTERFEFSQAAMLEKLQKLYTQVASKEA